MRGGQDPRASIDTPGATRTVSDLHDQYDRTDREDLRGLERSAAILDPSPPGLPDFAPGVVRGGPQAHGREAAKNPFLTHRERDIIAPSNALLRALRKIA